MTFIVVFVIASKNGFNLKNWLGDEEKIKDTRKEIRDTLSSMSKVMTRYNDCIEKLTNSGYIHLNLSKIDLDDLAEELELDGILIDPEEARRLSNEQEENSEASSSPALSPRP